MRKVAVTGGIGSGKSTVSALFEEFGAYVVSTDRIVHQLLFPDTPIGKQVVDLLGPSVVKDKKFDREAIADLVFEDERALQGLEAILHPEIWKRVEKESQKAEGEGKQLFICEAPLLFEVGAELLFDEVIAVSAPLEACIERVGSRQEYERRSKRQWTPEAKNTYADIILVNDASLKALRERVKRLYNQLVEG